MNMFKFSLLAGALLANSGGAVAQPGPGPGPGGFDRRGGLDGAVTQDQAIARADEMFTRMDLNRDGQVTPDEARQAMRARMAERRERGSAPGDPGMDGPDRPGMRHPGGPGMDPQSGPREGGRPGMRGFDDNGVMTREAFRARALERFARMDINRDGTVTPDERRVSREQGRQERREHSESSGQN